MVKKKERKVSLDDLAGMVAKGFDSVEQRIDSVEQRIDSVEQRMVTKDEFRVVRGEFHEANDEFRSRFNKIESKIDDVYEILALFEEGDILDLQKRVKILEKTVRAIGKHLG